MNHALLCLTFLFLRSVSLFSWLKLFCYWPVRSHLSLLAKLFAFLYSLAAWTVEQCLLLRLWFHQAASKSLNRRCHWRPALPNLRCLLSLWPETTYRRFGIFVFGQRYASSFDFRRISASKNIHCLIFLSTLWTAQQPVSKPLFFFISFPLHLFMNFLVHLRLLAQAAPNRRRLPPGHWLDHSQCNLLLLWV